jgi:hypothetical protein
MGTFEIKWEDDGFSLGKYRVGPEGKYVSEVVKHLKKKGLDGILLEDDTMDLTDNNVLIVGGVYKFRPSIDVLFPGL